jgi:sigma-B regulation protein RsbU (phosphoserine phosphatase)
LESPHPTQPALTDFVDRSTLQALQDGFSAATGIAISIRDPHGEPITRPAGRPAFCDIVSSTPSGERACRQSHCQAAALVQEGSEPRRHECHAGLSQFVAPIALEGQHLGAIIVGDRPVRPLTPAALTGLAREHGLPAEDLAREGRSLETWSEGRLAAATGFVQQLADTITQLCFQAYQLRRRVDELAALHELASMLSGRAELQDILDMGTQQLVATMGLRASSLRLLDEDTGELKLASVANLSREYLDKGPVQLSESPIDRAALEGRTVYVEDSRSDPRIIYPEKARREGLVSALVTAVAFRGKRIGVLRGYMDRVHHFTPFEVSLLEAIAAQLAAAIVNARLRRDAHQAEHMARQIRCAADVQRRMIPAAPPASPHYRFGCIYQPSSDLGGDFYDFIRFDNGDLGVVVADVVGKGVPASLMMASARSALRSHARRVTDIGEIMVSVNRRLYHDTLPSEFVTAFYLELLADGSCMKYCNAGHEPLLLLREGRVTRLDAGGLALGIEREEEYTSTEQALLPGDVLLLVTDGLTEARNYDGQAYGRQRVEDSLIRHGHLPVETLASQLLWDVRRFAGLAPMGDDLTLVVIRVEGAPAR